MFNHILKFEAEEIVEIEPDLQQLHDSVHELWLSKVTGRTEKLISTAKSNSSCLWYSRNDPIDWEVSDGFEFFQTYDPLRIVATYQSYKWQINIYLTMFATAKGTMSSLMQYIEWPNCSNPNMLIFLTVELLQKHCAIVSNH